MRLTTLLLALLTSLGMAQAPDACPPDDAPIAIHDVQGDDRRSPLVGEVITVEGVVSATFLGRDALEGFFVQDAVGDGNSDTSEGLFVRLAGRDGVAEPVPAAGDLVRVRGRVLERNELTQLDRLEALTVCGKAGLPEPVVVALPVASPNSWEALEGMLVAFETPLVVTEVFNLSRYGEVSLADGRLFIPSNGQPGQGDTRLRRVLLGDASRVENPARVPLLGDDLTLRVGDSVEGLEAVVVNYGLSAYRLEPIASPTIRPTNLRTARPADVGGELRVAAFNVHNYFTSLNERGADTPEELERQTAKLVAALRSIDADLVGLVEVENGSGAAQALADALNAANPALGEDAYAVMPDPGSGTGSDQIKGAILYRPGRLELVGSASDTADVHDRPPIAGTFRDRASAEVFTLIVTHFKSKGSCPAGGDTDEGYGCWNLRRSAQADATIAFADRIRRATSDPDVLVMGDLNSYRAEPPVALFEAAGYRNLDALIPAEERYTYVFFGESGTLDYALASTSLAARVTGMTNWHINSDEPPALDYNTEFNPAYLYQPTPYRSSDHDPVIVGLALGNWGELSGESSQTVVRR